MRRPLRIRMMAGLALAVSAAATTESRAAQYYLSVDVPTTLGGATYTPNQILRTTGGAYLVELTFAEDIALADLDRRPDGLWLLTPAFPIVSDDPEDLTVETRDVILYDAVNDIPSVALDGSAVGIPDYAAIDAALYDDLSGWFVMSFDVPVNLGGVEYDASDLVGFGGSWLLLWDASAAGVPLSANVVGFDVDRSGQPVLTFDAPVTLGGTTFVPGQLVVWQPGTGFALYASDPGWPASSAIAGFAFLPAAGEVPDGTAGSVPLTATPAAGGDLNLSWDASCSLTDTDYAVYEGALAAPFDSHLPMACGTSGATTLTFTPSAGNRYYLVVPRNAVTEGSYGASSALIPRPPSAAACLPQEVDLTCP